MNNSYTETSSIRSLISLNSLAHIHALNTIGIYSLRDMAEFGPCRYAEILVGSIENGTISDLDLSGYLDNAVAENVVSGELNQLRKLPIKSIKGIGDGYDEIFQSIFQVYTIEDLAKFPAFTEAKSIILHRIQDEFYEKPSAPQALIPKPIGSTHTQVRFSNYVKEKEHTIKQAALKHLAAPDEPTPEREVIDAFIRSQFKFHLGYLALFKQKWINVGTHLGEILHSVALAPGESRNVAFLDWYSRQTSSRSENTQTSEELSSEFYQNRALNEVVSTTAFEHQFGKTEIDSTTETTGQSKTSGIGGGASLGGSVKGDLTAVAGFPLEVAGAGLASLAGSTGKSRVYSNSTTQGTLSSETSGERTVTAEVTQNIADSTIQNASNVRSLMSTVVIEDAQFGGQAAQTKNITNYNHSHALTMHYYEVLQKYNINTFADKLTPVFYLPFSPINFNISIIKKYWNIFSAYLKQVLSEEKFISYDQVVKDFNPANGAFNYGGNIHIGKIRIRRSKQFSRGVRVTLYEAEPQVTLNISPNDMSDALDLIIKGGAVYVDYPFLAEQVFEQTRFAGQLSMSLSEALTASIKSNFKSVLEEKMRWYLDKNSGKTRRTSENDKEDNEIGNTSNRNSLKQQVTDTKYRLENEDEFIEFSLNIEYELLDDNGNSVTVLQNYDDTISFRELYSEFDTLGEDIIDINEYIDSHLLNVSEINPAHLIEDLESHFRNNKYGYTKYFLNYIEKEQIIDMVEHLGIVSGNDSLPLTDIIDPNPLGITENLLIFKLKNATAVPRDVLETIRFSASYKINNVVQNVVFEGIGQKRETTYRGKAVIHYDLKTEDDTWSNGPYISQHLNLYVSKSANVSGKHPYQGTVKTIQKRGSEFITSERSIQGIASRADAKKITFSYKQNTSSVDLADNKKAAARAKDYNIDLIVEITAHEQSDPLNIDIITNNYIDDIKAYEEIIKNKQQKDTVFLPTNGVFGEAILGLSNASEYINISRFYNWQDSPIPNIAPRISDVGVNQDYAKDISGSINPNAPVSVLNQISPQQMPGTSLGSALSAVQNGGMFTDMSKTSDLTQALKELSTLANNTAQLAGTLSGEAASNALNAAVELGKQVAGMVNTAMTKNLAAPPQTQTAQGGVRNAIEEMPTESDGTVSLTDEAIAGAMGAPINPSTAGTSAAQSGSSQTPSATGGLGSGSGPRGGSDNESSGGANNSGNSGTTGNSTPPIGGNTETNYASVYEPGERGEFSSTTLKFELLHTTHNYNGALGWETSDYLLYGFGIEQFEVDITLMSRETQSQLDDLYKRMKTGFNRTGDDVYGLHLTFVGFSDSAGEDSYNQALRENRARAAFRYLSDKASADYDFPHPNRFQASFPANSDLFVADNSSRTGRERNRGVIIIERWVQLPAGTTDPRSPLADWPGAMARGEQVWWNVYSEAVAGGFMGATERRILELIKSGQITDTKYFDRSLAITYMSNNLYTQEGISPERYAQDFKTYLYAWAVVNEGKPEEFASDMRNFLLMILNPGTNEVNKQLHLLFTAQENESTVRLADFIRERQQNPKSIYYYVPKR